MIKSSVREELFLLIIHFFRCFLFHFSQEMSRLVLKEPYTVILSEELIKKIFDYNGTDYESIRWENT